MTKTIHQHVEDIDRRWLLIDAEGLVLGRLATEVAVLLRGKHKPIFSPHMDTGDFVVIVNAERVVLTGHKLKDKLYYRHSGFPGGLKTTSAAQMMRTHPTRILEAAVRGMLPKTKLGAALFRKLKVYAGPTHPHASQQPTPFVSKTIQEV
ncbi:50S ribosomal protein L13 [Candidatus Methylomirabilis limnetica]|jgi:large subunit ribosomal protein L13|uniref:Large ribosomal subunit protein uL13 n=1 Tax=Candidatus Methylomirabilis limnetica TaxID=2033718 RepID=A0A2T4TV35_9BACT|nr:50S ribosomal protein L13 [Candidatus Methylomirabilis limnetica]PTL34972.1 50S ribosomal protein L13 [Candidatus Methylomirabilis limnetica]